jgi:hypothetical protein
LHTSEGFLLAMAAQDKTAPAITLPPGYNFNEANYSTTPAPTEAAPPLGVLSNFTGTFAGTGFNTIFRPNSKAPTTTTFPIPVTQPVAPPQPPNENVLELNLTTETLTFSGPLGDVPNRGLINQNDIHLNGVPYVQAINDVTNLTTGKGDDKPQPIHFEPGLWMNVPATTTSPILANSLVRMASIPHGTTINAQGLAPTAPIPGPLTIPPVQFGITPFPTGQVRSTSNEIRFPSQDVTNPDTARLPQDLSKFVAAGTITQNILDNPNYVLNKANEGKKIVNFFVFQVSTKPQAPELGGGVANIAFLEGSATGAGANANASQMTATFWIETVEHEIEVPVFKPGQPPLRIRAPTINPNTPAPIFSVLPPHEITAPKKIIVHSTQIQYSQVVFLDFAGLTWPHVSVATLVPTYEQPVPPAAWT